MKLVQCASSQTQQDASTCDTGGKSEFGVACLAVLSGNASFVNCCISSIDMYNNDVGKRFMK
jgi:hypothetical protein